MEHIFYYISIIADAITIVVFIAGIVYFRKTILQNVSHNQSDSGNMESTGSQNTNIDGDGNTVKNDKK